MIVKHNKQRKIVSIGSYNVGLTLRTPRLPAWGETLLGQGFSESYGGKGSNQAVAAAKLGGDVTFIGCLGEDKYGDDGLSMMQEAGIDTSHIIRTSEASTGVGIILLNEANDNCILVDLGANNYLTPAHLGKLKQVIEEADIVIFQLETPLETVKQGMDIAHRAGKTVIFNPAPANPEAIELLPYATIVNPNESELLLLNGKPAETIVDDDTCKQLAQNLLQEGPETVIVTRGEKPTMLVTNESVEQIAPVEVRAVDTTGAGDAFTGALAIALAEGKQLAAAVAFANLAGAHCVLQKEVIPGLATTEQLTAFQQQLKQEGGDSIVEKSVSES